MQPTPTVETIRETCHSLGQAAALIVVQLGNLRHVRLRYNAETGAVRAPTKAFDPEGKVGDDSRLSSVGAHDRNLGNGFLEVGGAEEGERTPVKGPTRERIDGSSGKRSVVLSMVKMDLFPIGVRFKVDAGHDKRHPLTVRMYTRIRESDQLGEVFGFHQHRI